MCCMFVERCAAVPVLVSKGFLFRIELDDIAPNGYYTYMLLLASIVGVICFLYSWFSLKNYVPV